MKLPSIVYILSEAKRSALRFPLVLIAAVVAAVCAILLVDAEKSKDLLASLLMASQMGIPLLIALTLLAERRGGEGRRSGLWLGGQILGLAALVAYFFALPAEIDGAALTRFFQLNIGLHLLVAFLPYLGFSETSGFWQFNKTLFLRFLAGAIFSATLYCGLSIALFALDKLFGVPVDGVIYLRLWMLVVFLFNTWYFLGGIPPDVTALDELRDYPRILKIFAQYILAPLVAVYLSIMLAYLVKVVFTAQWPSGWIGYLVSSVAAVGLFSLLLLHPLAEEEENRWIKTYARLFHILLLPAIVMLLLAIYKRVDQYGITENRYFLIVLTIWLAFVALRGLFVKKRGLKILPMTLCLLAFLCSCGPWGAYSVARNSQTGRLADLLAKNQLLAGETLVSAPAEVSFEDRKEMSAIFDYLIKWHGTEAVSDWFDDSLTVEIAELSDSLSSNEWSHPRYTRVIMSNVGLEYVHSWADVDDQWYRFTRDVAGDLVDIAGYDFVRSFRLPREENSGFEIDGVSYEISRPDEGETLAISAAGEVLLELPLTPLIAGLRDYAARHGNTGQAPGVLMTSAASGNGLRAKLLLTELNWWEGADETRIERLEAFLLLSAQP